MLSRPVMWIVTLTMLALTACGGDDDASSPTSAPSTTAQATTTSKTASPTTAAPTTTTTPPVPKIGEPQQTPGGNTATIYEVRSPAEPDHALVLAPPAGQQSAAVDAELCIRSDYDTATGVPIFEDSFTVVTADHRVWSFWNVQEYALSPRWGESPLVAGQCSRGWITYLVPVDAVISQVRFDPGGGVLTGKPPLVWTA
jgi:hypothetical protein